MDWRALAALSKEHLGVLALDHAPQLGMTRRGLTAFARRHGWQRPYRGVVVAPGFPESFEQRCKIATVAAGPERVLVSRQAAAYLLGMTRDEPAVIELVVPADRFVLLQGLEGVTVWRSSTLVRGDATERLSIPLTSAPRTILDMAAVLELDEGAW